MPKQLTQIEISLIIKQIADEIGAKTKEDFSKLMPAVIKKLKGQADGKQIRSEVERYLSSNWITLTI